MLFLSYYISLILSCTFLSSTLLISLKSEWSLRINSGFSLIGRLFPPMKYNGKKVILYPSNLGTDVPRTDVLKGVPRLHIAGSPLKAQVQGP